MLKKKVIFSVCLVLLILFITFFVGFDLLMGARVGTSINMLFESGMAGFSSTKCLDTNRELLPTLTEEEIDQYTVSYPSGFDRTDESTLRKVIDKSRCQKYDPVSITMDHLTFNVPMNYLTPWGDFKNQIETDGLWATIFLPDYNGFDRRNFIDNFDQSKIQVRLYPESNPPGPEVDLGVARLVKFEAYNRSPRLDQYDLMMYKASLSERIMGVGVTSDGEKFSVSCSTATPIKNCQMEYHHKLNGYWMILEFNYKHLSGWKDIDKQVNQLVSTWRMQ